MEFNFLFRGIETNADISVLMDFMGKQALSYPDYDTWLQKIEPEFYNGSKNAVLAFSDNKLVGDLVYQPHKSLVRSLELKNLRIHPDLRRRDFSHFMLKQIETEARNSGKYDQIISDTRASQEDVLRAFSFAGYQEIERIALYDSNEEDVLVVNPLSKKN